MFYFRRSVLNVINRNIIYIGSRIVDKRILFIVYISSKIMSRKVM